MGGTGRGQVSKGLGQSWVAMRWGEISVLLSTDLVVANVHDLFHLQVINFPFCYKYSFIPTVLIVMLSLYWVYCPPYFSIIFNINRFLTCTEKCRWGAFFSYIFFKPVLADFQAKCSLENILLKTRGENWLDFIKVILQQEHLGGVKNTTDSSNS